VSKNVSFQQPGYYKTNKNKMKTNKTNKNLRWNEKCVIRSNFKLLHVQGMLKRMLKVQNLMFDEIGLQAKISLHSC